MNEKQLKRWSEIQQALEGGAVQPAELKQIVEVIFGLIKELNERLKIAISTGDNDTMKKCMDMMPSFDGVEKKLNSAIAKVKDSAIKDMKSMVKSCMDEIQSLRDSIPDISPLEEKIDDVKRSIPVIKDTILDTPVQIREKVQSLPEGQRWDIADVNDLRKEMDAVKQEIRSIPRGGNKAIMPRTGGVAFEKLNSRLDSLTKTFYIPNMRDVIVVMGTSFPTVFASADDYTVGNKSITFTDQIDAATTLAAGQTVVVVYNQLHYT